MEVPSLQQKAALVLFQRGTHPELFSPWNEPVTAIQKALRFFLSRARTFLGPLHAPMNLSFRSGVLSRRTRFGRAYIDPRQPGNMVPRLFVRIERLDQAREAYRLPYDRRRTELLMPWYKPGTYGSPPARASLVCNFCFNSFNLCCNRLRIFLASSSELHLCRLFFRLTQAFPSS